MQQSTSPNDPGVITYTEWYTEWHTWTELVLDDRIRAAANPFDYTWDKFHDDIIKYCLKYIYLGCGMFVAACVQVCYLTFYFYGKITV